MKVVFSAEAKAGLREIALFIGSDDKARALSFVRELRAKAQQLGDMPRGFPLVPRYEHLGTRRRSLGEYLISTESRRIRLLSSIRGEGCGSHVSGARRGAPGKKSTEHPSTDLML